jgi:copper chaperone
MCEIEIRIENMSCDHCVRAVRQSLGSIPGVEVENVVVGSARIRYDQAKVTVAQIHGAIEEAGYSVGA